MAKRHAVTDAQWEVIQAHWPTTMGRPSDDRNFIDAVAFRLNTGIQWRDLPERFGRWSTIFTRYNNWAKAGWWAAISEALQIDFEADIDDDEEDDEAESDGEAEAASFTQTAVGPPDKPFAAAIIDGSVVRAHQSAAGGKGGSWLITWDVPGEASLPKFTPSSMKRAARYTSNSHPGKHTTSKKLKTF